MKNKIQEFLQDDKIQEIQILTDVEINYVRDVQVEVVDENFSGYNEKIN